MLFLASRCAAGRRRRQARVGGWRWWPLAPALLLAACADRPPLATPDPALPAAYEAPTGAGTAPLADTGAALPDWPAYFTDARLRTLIGQALAHNRDLRLAALRVAEARAAYGIQHADGLPTVALGADATRARTPADLNLSRRPLLGNQFQVGVGLASWELDLWGRVRALDDAALRSFLASDASRRAVALGLVLQVAQADLALRELDERLALARQAEASRAESLRIFRRRTELGATARLELTQVELLWQQAGALVQQLALARAQQAHALALLVGDSAAAPPPGERLDAVQLAAPLAPGLPSRLLLQRPDVRAAELALAAAEAQIDAARAAFFPRIALTGRYGTASAELDGLFQAGSGSWSFVPALSLPLFDRGRRQAGLSLAEVRRDQAVARYEQVVQSAFRDVSDALAARHWLAGQRATLQATEALLTERARLARLRYDSGAARYLEVLDAERDLLATAQQSVQVRRAQLAADVALYAALGGAPLDEPAAAVPKP